MIQRYVKIKNFRNIGDNQYERFDLNAIPDARSKLGGLVTLIGMNNTGKSNYLDALYALETKTFGPSDEPFFSYESDRDSTVTLWVKDTDEKAKKVTEFQYKVKQGQVYVEHLVDNKKVEYKPMVDEPIALNLPSVFQDILDQMGNPDIYVNAFNQWRQQNRRQPGSHEEFPFMGDQNAYIDTINRVISQIGTKTDYLSLIPLLEHQAYVSVVQNNYGFANTIHMKAFSDHLKKGVPTLTHAPILDVFSETYQFSLMPSIIKYDDSKSVKSDDTKSAASKEGLGNPGFFKTLFSLLKDRNYEELENAYKKFNTSKNGIHYLSNFEALANEGLAKLSESFNRIYGYANDKQYQFTLKLESTMVYFILSENNSDVPFESQSTGFKWFFNFFFNVFANNNLKNGDIVILDEPATNLHVSGQIELRKQIKRFGLENGITFVLSTHSPFLIDVDYLDEIRIVTKQGNVSSIENKFSVSDKRLVDALMPIQSSLTVDRHVIHNSDKTLIFVEGITDYNYLVAFKNHLKYDQLTFMPIQGIKDTSTVFKSLMKTFKNPIILVDSDFYGQQAKKAVQDQKHEGIEVRVLNEVNESFMTIEDLFAGEDRATFIPEKSFDRSSHFKTCFEQYKSKLSKETINNFKALLDNLKA